MFCSRRFWICRHLERKYGFVSRVYSLQFAISNFGRLYGKMGLTLRCPFKVPTYSTWLWAPKVQDHSLFIIITRCYLGVIKHNLLLFPMKSTQLWGDNMKAIKGVTIKTFFSLPIYFSPEAKRCRRKFRIKTLELISPLLLATLLNSGQLLQQAGS